MGWGSWLICSCTNDARQLNLNGRDFCTLVLNIENLGSNQTKMGRISSFEVLFSFCFWIKDNLLHHVKWGEYSRKTFSENSEHFTRFSSLKIVLRDDDVMGFLEHSWTKRFGPFGQLLAICFPLFNKVKKEKIWFSKHFVTYCPKTYFFSTSTLMSRWSKEWACDNYLGVNSDAVMERKRLIITRYWFTQIHLATILPHHVLFFSTCGPSLMWRRS